MVHRLRPSSAARALATLAGVLLLASPARAACPGECPIPGGSTRLTDCVVEFDGPALNQPPSRPRELRCVDGDPSCDADGTPNGTCRLRFSACLNNADPRLPLCTPTDVATFTVRNKPVGHPKFDPELQALEASVAGLLPTAAAVCGPPRPVTMPLRVKAGVFRKVRKKLSTLARTSGGVLDRDKMQLTCLPSPLVPAPGATFALAREITAPGELIEGPLARGDLGDFLLANDRIQVVIQKPGRVMFGIGIYGGNIIDADRQRPDGDERDHFEEWAPGINIENTANYTSVTVLNDGTNGQPAVVRASGPDDLLDFINPSTVVAGFGFAFPPGADDVDLPVEVQTDYTLEPGKDYVKVDTTVTNTGAAPLDIFFNEYLGGSGQIELFQPAWGFGEPLATTGCHPSTFLPCTAGTCDPCNYVAYSGEDGAEGVSYAYVHGVNASSTFATSGVVVPLLGRSVVLTLIGAQAPNFHLNPSGTPGDAFTVTRYFVVGDGSVASLVDVRNEILGIANTGTLAGVVTSGGQPLANADVAVLGSPFPGGPSRNVVNHFRTAADGSYRGTLPAGSYTVRANKDGRLFGTPDPATVVITAGATTNQSFDLPAAGRLRVTVTDENGDPSPAKVQLVGFDPSPDPLNTQSIFGLINNTTGVFGEQFEDGLQHGIAFVTFPGADGDTGEVEVEPGTYQLVVSRGPRYSAFQQPVTITAGTTTAVAAQIAKVVDTPGFVSGDFHVHAIDSPDAEVTREERVLTELSEGMDFFTPSDHEFRADFAPTIAAMGVSSLIATATSAEITTFDYGHFNSWPVTVDPSQLHGGGVDWGRAGIAPGMDFPSLGSFNLAPAEIFATALADPLANIIQINHMRSHFNADGLDIDTAMTPPQSHTPPLTRRLDPGIPNLFDAGFDALEVWIGTDGRNGDLNHFLGENLGDWFNLLNQGILRAGVASSDTHSRRTTQINARTYIASAVTDPGLLAAQAETLAANVKAGKAIGTNAPFVSVSLSAPSTGDVAGLGVSDANLVETTDGSVTLTVTVRSPAWAEFDRIQVFANNAPQPYDHDADPGTRDRYRVIPNVEKVAGVDFTVTTVNDFPAIPGAAHLEATVPITLDMLAQDTWIVVVVRGTDGVSRPLFPVLPNSLRRTGNTTLADLTDGNLNEDGLLALAFTNPLFVDVDGGGWTPPGVMLTPP